MRNPTPERIASVLRLYADPDQKWNEVMLRSVMNDMAKALDAMQTDALSHAAGQEAVVSARDVFRIAGGDTECCPNPSAKAAMDCLIDLRACYDEGSTINPAEIGRKSVGVEAVAGQWELVPSGFLIDGPNGTAMVFCRAFIEPKIAALCENNGDDPEDYTATELYVKAWRGRAVDMPTMAASSGRNGDAT